MVSTQFTGVNEFLVDLLRRIGIAEIQLPDFQRDWRWGDQNIKSLLASVSLGIPMGAVLMMDSNDQLAPHLFEGVDSSGPLVDPRLLVLDGQQRLTALYQACYSTGPVETKNERSVTRRRYYFRMQDAVDGSTDREEWVDSKPAATDPASEPKTQFDEDLFPASQMFNYQQWRDQYLEHHDYKQEKRSMSAQFYDAVVSHFERYNVPTIRMTSDDLDSACLAFEKMNLGGTRLNAFEIITAKLRREEFNLKDDWQAQKSNMDMPALRKINSIHYLKAVTLVATQKLATQKPNVRASARRKDMLNLDRQRYEDLNKNVTQGFVKTAEQLKELGIIQAKELAYVPQAIVMASIYAHCPTSKTNTVLARNVFKTWYWTTLLNGSYGSRVSDTQMANDFTEIVNMLTNDLQLSQSSFSGNPFPAVVLEGKAEKNLQGAIQILLAKERGTRDWMTGRPIQTESETKSEMHHIFPRKWCEDHNIGVEHRESVANMTLIDEETNRLIGPKAPSEYLEILQKQAGNISEQEMDKTLESHLIPAQALRADDFEAFHKERARRLKEMIVDIIGADRVA